MLVYSCVRYVIDNNNKPHIIITIKVIKIIWDLIPFSHLKNIIKRFLIFKSIL